MNLAEMTLVVWRASIGPTSAYPEVWKPCAVARRHTTHKHFTHYGMCNTSFFQKLSLRDDDQHTWNFLSNNGTRRTYCPYTTTQVLVTRTNHNQQERQKGRRTKMFRLRTATPERIFHIVVDIVTQPRHSMSTANTNTGVDRGTLSDFIQTKAKASDIGHKLTFPSQVQLVLKHLLVRPWRLQRQVPLAQLTIPPLAVVGRLRHDFPHDNTV